MSEKTWYRVTFKAAGEHEVEVAATGLVAACDLAWAQFLSLPGESEWAITDVEDINKVEDLGQEEKDDQEAARIKEEQAQARPRRPWTDEQYRSVRVDGVVVLRTRSKKNWFVSRSDFTALCFPGTARPGWWPSREQAKQEADKWIPVRLSGATQGGGA